MNEFDDFTLGDAPRAGGGHFTAFHDGEMDDLELGAIRWIMDAETQEPGVYRSILVLDEFDSVLAERIAVVAVAL